MRHIAFALVTLAISSFASAQAGPALLLNPWTEGQFVEVHSRNTVLSGGDATLPGGATSDRDLRVYDVAGRVRLPEQPNNLSLGFDFSYIDVDGAAGIERLVSQSVAIGARLGQWNNWTFDTVLGVGYAGTTPFDEDEPWHAKAMVMATTELAENQSLQLFLGYDRNRSIFPDIPLPGVAYVHNVSDELQYIVGLPYSSITWKPADRLTLLVRYLIPVTIDLQARYDLTEQLAVFASFENRLDAFFIEARDDRDRRYFFRQRTVEAGVELVACPNATFTASVGYAFSQEIEVGWDVRDTSSVAEFSDEPFVRLGVELGF